MNVVFRADSSIGVGAGHIMRCFGLASALRECEHQVSFICRNVPGNLIEWLKGQGIYVHQLPKVIDTRTQAVGDSVDWQVDAKLSLAILDVEQEIDWVVVDHYSLDERWESVLARRAHRIAVIDDLANRAHACDLLIDQNLRDNCGNPYAELVPPRCRVLLGPQYALLRPEFRAVRRTRAAHDGIVRRVLVSLGGTDASCATARVISALSSLPKPLEVDVVVGSGNSQINLIRQLCSKFEFEFHCQPANIADLMARADLAIGGGGATTWERCCVGLPSIMIVLAENQRAVAAAMASLGAGVVVGDSDNVAEADLQTAILRLLAQPETVRSIAQKCSALVDGLGTDRVLEAFTAGGVPMDRFAINSKISLRTATSADARTLWSWRNEAGARVASYNSALIPFEDHVTWLQKRLDDPNTRILIGQDATQGGIGYARLDIKDEQAEISLTISRDLRGRGLGKALIDSATKYALEELHLQRVIAYVKSESDASLGAFRGAGFTPIAKVNVAGHDSIKLIYPWEAKGSCRFSAVSQGKTFPTKNK